MDNLIHCGSLESPNLEGEVRIGFGAGEGQSDVGCWLWSTRNEN